MTVGKTARIALSACWSLSALAVLATVFVVAPDLWNGTVSGKYFWFFTAQSVFTAMTLLGTLSGRGKGEYVFSVLDLLVVLFVGYVWLNSAVRGQGFEIKLYLLLLLGMFYACLRIWLQTIPSARGLLCLALIGTAGVESVVGLMQLYGWSHSHHALYRITGHFFNPGPFSGYVALAVPLAVYCLLAMWSRAAAQWKDICRIVSGGGGFPRETIPCGQVAGKTKRILWGEGNGALLTVGLSALALGAALLVIPAAMSRSAWMAIFAGVAVVAMRRYDGADKVKRCFRTNRKRSLILLAALVVLGGVAFAGVYNLKRGSAEGRLFLWKVAAEAMAQRPVFGVGLGNFAGAYGEAQYEYFRRGVGEQEALRADSPAYAFNEYLQTGVEEGAAGLLLLLGVAGVAVGYCLRDKEKTGVLGAIVAMLVFSLTSYPLSVLPVCIAFLSLLSLSNDGHTGVRLPGSRYMMAFVLLVGGCFCFMIELKPVRQAYRSYRDTKEMMSLGYFDVVGDLEKCSPFLSRSHDFMFSYGQALGKTGRYGESNEILLKGAALSSDPMFYNLIGNNYLALGEVEKAEEYYWKAYYTLPNRHYPLYLLAKLYHETGQDEKARSMARMLLDKKAKVASTAIREMQDYAKKILGGENGF